MYVYFHVYFHSPRLAAPFLDSDTKSHRSLGALALTIRDVVVHSVPLIGPPQRHVVLLRDLSKHVLQARRRAFPLFLSLSLIHLFPLSLSSSLSLFPILLFLISPLPPWPIPTSNHGTGRFSYVHPLLLHSRSGTAYRIGHRSRPTYVLCASSYGICMELPPLKDQIRSDQIRISSPASETSGETSNFPLRLSEIAWNECSLLLAMCRGGCGAWHWKIRSHESHDGSISSPLFSSSFMLALQYSFAFHACSSRLS